MTTDIVPARARMEEVRTVTGRLKQKHPRQPHLDTVGTVAAVSRKVTIRLPKVMEVLQVPVMDMEAVAVGAVGAVIVVAVIRKTSMIRMTVSPCGAGLGVRKKKNHLLPSMEEVAALTIAATNIVKTNSKLQLFHYLGFYF